MIIDSVKNDAAYEAVGKNSSTRQTDVVMNAAVQSVESALKSGAMTFTELDDVGAILMLSQRDEMLTINATAAWLIARLQQRGTDANFIAEFAANFAIPIDDAAADIERFFLQLAKSLN